MEEQDNLVKTQPAEKPKRKRQPGAGRIPLYGERKIQTTVRITRPVISWLETHGESVGEAVEALVRRQPGFTEETTTNAGGAKRRRRKATA